MMAVTIQAVNRWRNAYCLPGLDSLYILSKVLKVSMYDLLVPVKGKGFREEEDQAWYTQTTEIIGSMKMVMNSHVSWERTLKRQVFPDNWFLHSAV